MWKERSTMSMELITERLIRASKIRSLDEAAVYEFMAYAVDVEVDPREVKELYEMITLQQVKSDFAMAMNKLQQSIDSPGALDEAMEKIRSLKALQPTPSIDLCEQLDKAIDTTDRASSSLIPYGIPSLDRHLGGANRKEVEVIAARPGHGKTSLACQFILNWLSQGFKVMVISKEMDTSRLLHKLLANAADISSKSIKMGSLTPDEKTRMKTAAEKMKQQYNGRFWIFDDVYDSRKIETLASKYRPDVIVDDFLQLSNYDNDNTRGELTRIMKHYKEMVKAYDMNITTLSQMNRGVEKREDPRPMLSDLAEADTIGQLAATVLMLFYGYNFNPLEYPQDQIEVIVPKNRYGETFSTVLGFDGDKMRYTSMPGGMRR